MGLRKLLADFEDLLDVDAGETRDELDPGFLYGIDFLFGVNSFLRVGVQAAYHQFDETETTTGGGTANVGITDLALLANVRWPWGPYRVFLAGGPGWYRFGGGWHPGWQLGAGFEIPVISYSYLIVGATGHAVQGGTPNDPRWIDGYLGFRFRVP